MDSQDKEKLNLRPREEMLARRVAAALDQMDPSHAAECPDAEVIAAYAEQGLDRAESSQWETHFATCPRCRKILRVLVASADAPLAETEVARLGKIGLAARAPAETTTISAKSARPILLDWRMRWLAPTLGVAAVVAVWFAVRPPWRTPGQGATSTLVAQAPREEAPPNTEVDDRLSKEAAKQDQAKEHSIQRDGPSTKGPPRDGPAETPARPSVSAAVAIESVPPNDIGAVDTLQSDQKFGSLSRERESRSEANPASPPSSPLPEMKAEIDAPVPAASDAKEEADGAPAKKAQNESNANATSAAQVRGGPAPQAAAAAQSSPPVFTGTRKTQSLETLKETGTSALVKSPSGSILWRAEKGGSIERSNDTGATWERQASASREDWLAGSAVSDRICWLAGRNGVIGRTTDGEHWERVEPPSLAIGSGGTWPDWTAIVARDGQSATITARDGRRFATRDAGKTWQAR